MSRVCSSCFLRAGTRRHTLYTGACARNVLVLMRNWAMVVLGAGLKLVALSHGGLGLWSIFFT